MVRYMALDILRLVLVEPTLFHEFNVDVQRHLKSKFGYKDSGNLLPLFGETLRVTVAKNKEAERMLQPRVRHFLKENLKKPSEDAETDLIKLIAIDLIRIFTKLGSPKEKPSA